MCPVKTYAYVGSKKADVIYKKVERKEKRKPKGKGKGKAKGKGKRKGKGKGKRKEKKPTYLLRGIGYFRCGVMSPKRTAIIGEEEHRMGIFGKFKSRDELTIELWNKHLHYHSNHVVQKFRLIYVATGTTKRKWVEVKRQPNAVKIINNQLEEFQGRL